MTKMSYLKTSTLVVLWLSVVALGFRGLLRYEAIAAQPATLAGVWPCASLLSRSTASPFTLLMFVHPHCPCSAASLSELNAIKTKCPDLAVSVLFLKPAGLTSRLSKDWERDSLWQRAATIPGVRLISDVDGSESDNFGALTSGQVALYNRAGHLVFNGGITGSRGHVGDNIGAHTVVAVVRGDGGFSQRLATTHHAAVFGCPLKDDRASLNEGIKACLQ